MVIAICPKCEGTSFTEKIKLSVYGEYILVCCRDCSVVVGTFKKC